jgi:hypothetical protein
LEGIVHVDYEDVVQLDQNLALIDHRAHTSFCDYPGLIHFFHSVNMFALLPNHSPHLPEAAFADAVVVNEFVFGHGLEHVWHRR